MRDDGLPSLVGSPRSLAVRRCQGFRWGLARPAKVRGPEVAQLGGDVGLHLAQHGVFY